MPKASIIIPTHNRPHMLPRTVESALHSGEDVEVIVVDDASTDATAEVCRSLAGIRYLRLERNQGVAGARNVGILASKASYVAFLDDDDLRLPGTIDLQIEALSKDPDAGFVCGAMLLANQERVPTGEAIIPRHAGGDVFWEMLELDFPVMPISVLIRKDCFLRVGLFNSRISGIDDWDIFVRIAELYRVLVDVRPVSIYRKPTPFSAQGSSGRARQLSMAARHQLRLLRLPRALAASPGRRREARRRTMNRISDVLLGHTAEQLAQGTYSVACANFLAALRLNPLGAARPAAFRKAWRTIAPRREQVSVADA
ncbi:MAG TPA: glycosyltransferase family A protein [Pyrinomonadaceae bacterium]|nr:glycosyltransferase family A protein [Pyrinomonadaceae bacterium]